ncbi:MFS transporter [Kocuria rhizophila]|uniref:MFS transporter n=1 Tax=Kocuria rhizophila TaxID=72000 RepID=UPI0022F0875D|nr:MFS transporter [Kocuria rhizophila]MDA4827611.1 MFS transporter [Kocuria rhizophila]WSY87928.1 MFS transporter [Kocuria rhizophila]WSZ53354.1 MFS transporter [Kocuria rhizophila]
MKLPRALAPFSSRAYTVLALAMGVSVFGSGLWAVAMVARVMELGGSAVDLSLVTAAGAVGMVVFVLVGGVAADRFRLTVILRCVEVTNLVTATTIVVLTWTDTLALWHLGAAAFVFSGAVGFFYPAYSAALPRILPVHQLLAANGVEGTARPLLQLAAGPAVGGALTGLALPGASVLAIAVCHAVALVFMLRLRLPERGGEDAQGAASPQSSMLREMLEGFQYCVRTPWLLWTLLWAMTAIFLFMGPLEVLVPFLVVDRLGGTVADYGAMLGLYGISTAVGSSVMASLQLPRKYLTTMIWLWGFGTLPFGLVGMTDSWWVMAGALCVFGATGGAGQVIWGTLLQRRVPSHMLGRISSLDFFVSLLLMPISMAVAGPVSQVVTPEAIFWGVALLTPTLGVVAVLVGRMHRDQAEHPLR